MEVSFIDDENWSTRRKPPIGHESPTNLSQKIVTSTPHHGGGSNSQTLVAIAIDCIGRSTTTSTQCTFHYFNRKKI